MSVVLCLALLLPPLTETALAPGDSTIQPSRGPEVSVSDAINATATRFTALVAAENPEVSNAKEATPPPSAPDAEKAQKAASPVGTVMPEDLLKQRIEGIKSKSGAGGMEKEEYFEFQNWLNRNPGYDLLVYGLGYDSTTINELNAGGDTRFLEPDVSWVEKADAETQKLKYEGVKYTSTLKDVGKFLAEPFTLPARTTAEKKCWDSVLIDSPMSYHPDHPGRMQAFHSAAMMAEDCLKSGKKAVHIWSHDNNRNIENLLSDVYFGKFEVGHPIGPKKLRHFELKPGFAVDFAALKSAASNTLVHPEAISEHLVLLSSGTPNHD